MVSLGGRKEISGEQASIPPSPEREKTNLKPRPKEGETAGNLGPPTQFSCLPGLGPWVRLLSRVDGHESSSLPEKAADPKEEEASAVSPDYVIRPSLSNSPVEGDAEMKELTEDIEDGTTERTPWQCMSPGAKFITVALLIFWLVAVLGAVIMSIIHPSVSSTLPLFILPTLAFAIVARNYFNDLKRRERERVAPLQAGSDIEVACPPRRRIDSRGAYISAGIVVVTSPMTLGFVWGTAGWDMAKEFTPFVLAPALVFALGMCLYARALRRKEEAEKSGQITAG
jgi:hypothetical protein